MGGRRIELARAAWGAVLLVSPRPVLRDVVGVADDHRSIVIARILGGRHLVQAAISGLAPTPHVLALGVWVDAVHSVTALGLAVADRSRVRAGVIDGVIAGVWCGFGYRDLASSSPRGVDTERRRDALAVTILHWLPGGGFLTRVATTTPKEFSS